MIWRSLWVSFYYGYDTYVDGGLGESLMRQIAAAIKRDEEKIEPRTKAKKKGKRKSRKRSKEQADSEWDNLFSGETVEPLSDWAAIMGEAYQFWKKRKYGQLVLIFANHKKSVN